MLAPIINLNSGQSHFAGSSIGTWNVWQIGQGWIAETPIGTMKVLNVQRIINAARSAGATIRWLD